MNAFLFVTRAGPTTLFRPILKKGAPNKTVLKKKNFVDMKLASDL